MRASARISHCGQYRYTLSRPPLTPYPDTGTAVFCMLNPSTADASLDDPTIRRCRGFAERWGCNGIIVVNLYALRSTDPRALWDHHDPVGPDNDFCLREVLRETNTVVCAWGTSAREDRVRVAVDLFRSVGAEMLCLGVTKDGSPRHPLYVRADKRLAPWVPAYEAGAAA